MCNIKVNIQMLKRLKGTKIIVQYSTVCFITAVTWLQTNIYCRNSTSCSEICPSIVILWLFMSPRMN